MFLAAKNKCSTCPKLLAKRWLIGWLAGWLAGWLVGWFYGMSTLVGLFYTKFGLTILVSNYVSWLKSLWTDQVTLWECDQMKFIWGLAEKFIGWPRYSHRMWIKEVYFLLSSPCGPHTSSIDVVFSVNDRAILFDVDW